MEEIDLEEEVARPLDNIGIRRWDPPDKRGLAPRHRTCGSFSEAAETDSRIVE
jgi:hypothetical protein